MNYYDACRLQGSDPAVWHYTSTNRRLGTYPVGYCTEDLTCDCVDLVAAYDGHGRADCEKCVGAGRVPNPDHCGGHTTPDAARECFRRFLLDGQYEETYGDWTGCEVCDAPTKKGLTTRRPLGNGHALCERHRTPEQLAELTPPVAQIAASY